MYDALIEDIDDDQITRGGKTLGLEEDSEDGVEISGGLSVDVAEEEEDNDAELELSEDLFAGANDESWSDDPVRMYLTQMGEIPLLTRQQEVSLAKQIELTRTRFRHKVLECDYVMQTAVKVLRRVHDGDLPFDRTVQVSVTDQLENGLSRKKTQRVQLALFIAGGYTSGRKTVRYSILGM